MQKVVSDILGEIKFYIDFKTTGKTHTIQDLVCLKLKYNSILWKKQDT